MKSTNKKRLDMLAAGVVFDVAKAVESDEAFLARLETKLDLPSGSLPRTIDEAVDAGYNSVIDALAGAIGVSYSELKEFLLSSSSSRW